MGNTKSGIKKLGIIEQFTLSRKLHSVKGITLSERQADAVIEDWKGQVKDQSAGALKLAKTAEQAERQVKQLDQAIISNAGNLKKARANYKQSKNPVKREEWARHLVLAGRASKELRESKKRLEDTAHRVGAAIEDARVVKTMLDARINEAEIYKSLNGSLTLVGQSLIDARTDHARAKVEIINIDSGITKLERTIESKSKDEIEAEISQYLTDEDDE